MKAMTDFLTTEETVGVVEEGEEGDPAVVNHLKHFKQGFEHPKEC